MLRAGVLARDRVARPSEKAGGTPRSRSEEHTSELQSQSNLVCRLLLEKKKTQVSRPIDLSPRSGPVRAPPYPPHLLHTWRVALCHLLERLIRRAPIPRIRI